jgi:hypothetical protein
LGRTRRTTRNVTVKERRKGKMQALLAACKINHLTAQSPSSKP